MRHVAISGAGLAGTLLAIMLAKRGYRVDIYERRPDPRAARIDFGRSINLALSARGSHALAQVGLLEQVLERGVAMRARAIHSVTGEIAYQAFGRTTDEHLYAIERHTLNAVLLDAATKYSNIRVDFEQRLTEIDFASMQLTFQDQRLEHSHQRACDCLVVTEGAFSSARKSMVDLGLAQFKLDELAHGYKELLIDVDHARDLKFESLHLWPRRSFMLIANPNPDHSFSCTLFMPHTGAEVSFSAVQTPEAVEQLFRRYFPDVRDRIPALVEDFFASPTGTLPTVQGGPWHVAAKVLLLGDAAHAIVPFFAQGMNSAFEDCTLFVDALDRAGDAWEEAIPAFFYARKPDTDAIADMAMQNYHEIQDAIADPRFLLRKHVEQELMRRHPETYTSMHVLVMFSCVPYAFAKGCGSLQSELLDQICEDHANIEQIRWPAVETRLARYAQDVKRLADQLGVDLRAANNQTAESRA
jgi:kynurenine 3-monooxygenase